ncbi:MAG: ZIP family metal transporter [Clostridia bacterium]|nr:ZIP family metal transporter [Clostridia bacterium]
MFEILLLSFAAGISTFLGSLMVMFAGRSTERSLALFLGLAAGIMCGVVFFDLLPSSLEYGNPLTSAVGFLLGVVVLLILDGMMGKIMNFVDGSFNASGHLLRLGTLVGIGIALHDFPEGIAIAAGYTAEVRLGVIIALAIGLHNIPEGMAVAAPLLMGGMGRRRTALVVALVSLVTPFGALLGFWLVNLSENLISLMLALAGGAMSYIVTLELVPEAVRTHTLMSAIGALAGFVIIFLLSGTL